MDGQKYKYLCVIGEGKIHISIYTSILTHVKSEWVLKIIIKGWNRVRSTRKQYITKANGFTVQYVYVELKKLTLKFSLISNQSIHLTAGEKYCAIHTKCVFPNYPSLQENEAV